MIIKVKKLSTLPTIRENQPERHIVYHTTVLLLFKLLYIPIILIFAAAFRGINEDIIFAGMISIDILTTHFIIQVSYLISNKTNLSTTLVKCGFSRYAEVVPEMETATIARVP
uniref:G protein-coupled receptor n=1 Tax=Caenorhabditis tropicalis TaxID=1561998 RepID=A0A1I7T6P7_9PELO